MKAPVLLLLLHPLRLLRVLLAMAMLCSMVPAHALRIKGSGRSARRAQQPVDGLRPGGGPGRHGRPDHADALPTQAMQNYLQNIGISLPPSAAGQLQLKNVAAVIVTAQLPAFAQPGQMIDVNVSSMGNSKSLKGGMLMVTPLRGADGEIYALAQGNLAVEVRAPLRAAARCRSTIPSAGRIPQGLRSNGRFRRRCTRATRSRWASTPPISRRRSMSPRPSTRMGAGRATAIDGRTVQVQAPTAPGERVGFIAQIEELPLETMVPAARWSSMPAPGRWCSTRRSRWAPAPWRMATCRSSSVRGP